VAILFLGDDASMASSTSSLIDAMVGVRRIISLVVVSSAARDLERCRRRSRSSLSVPGSLDLDRLVCVRLLSADSGLCLVGLSDRDRRLAFV
jgi:hypothetical protein